MGMEVEGKYILARIAEKPIAFGMSIPQINTLATTTLISRLKDKAAGLDMIRSIAGVIGAADFAVVLDHLSDRDAAALAKRLDPKNSLLKIAEVSRQRERIISLAQGEVEPTAAASKVSKSVIPIARSRTPKTGKVMESKALKPRTSRKTKSGT